MSGIYSTGGTVTLNSTQVFKITQINNATWILEPAWEPNKEAEHFLVVV